MIGGGKMNKRKFARMLGDMVSKLLKTRYLSVWLISAVDVLLSVVVSFFCLLVVKYLMHWPIEATDYALLLATSFVASVLAFYVCGVSRKIIRYSRLRDVLAFIVASFGKAVLLAIPFYFKFVPQVPVDQLIFGMIIDAGFTFLTLMFVRSLMIYVYEKLQEKDVQLNYNIQNIFIYGITKDAISLSIRLRNNHRYKVVGFCSRSEHVKRYKTDDLPVYQYESEEIFAKILRSAQVKAILFPTVYDVQKEQDNLLKICESQHIKVLVAPPIDEFDGQKGMVAIREVEVEDILNRPEIKIDMEEVKAMLKDKTIMVTGAAGSIGSEICRQLVKVGAGRIVAYEQAETPMHNLQLEMRDKYPYQRFESIVGDVLNTDRLESIFAKYRPQIVFHAAAYKHVPLMEENPCEAIRINVRGSKNIADLCLKFGVEKMIMVSTDKAVNPTNIMGASKRMAEIYVQSLGKAVSQGLVEGKTKYVTTRFGNVLGSNGSVLPRFREQIAKGGPVTVTHPDIIRFFMSIPEACRLVLQAGTIGQDNEIFVFDMGEPVRIADMARRMIALSGLREGEDINIEFTGLRPGEKLYEEVLSDKENTIPTSYEKIHIAKARQYDYEEVQRSLAHIIEKAQSVQIPEMVRLIRELVPEYVSRNSWLEKV